MAASNAERQRKAYRRSKDGRRCLRPAVRLNALVDAMIDAGLVAEDQSADMARVNEAAGAILDQWAAEKRSKEILTREGTTASKLRRFHGQ